ncbi:WD40-repeat-containing domain protein [Coemansia mojavensis]|nr:WD40-repeat-containing domain protein [Coemansia mojavensis]KAI9469499.1 WD40-repeat-containing domain protein [Coemansia mojavensis]
MAHTFSLSAARLFFYYVFNMHLDGLFAMDGSSINKTIRKRAQGSDLTSQRRISHAFFASISLSETKRIAQAHTATVCSLSLDATQQRLLLSAGADTSIHLFDLENTGTIESTQQISAGSGHSSIVSSVEWYPVDNGLFTSASLDHTLRVWDTNTMSEACQFDLEFRVYSHKMSPLGAHALIAAASESSYIRLCDLKSGAFTHSMLAHQSGCIALAWSPQQPYMLASGGDDGSIKLWDIRQTSSVLFGDNPGTNSARNGAISSLLFTGDGQRLVSIGEDGLICTWNTVCPQKPEVSVNSEASTYAKAIPVKAIEVARATTAATDVVFVPGPSGILAVDVYTGEQLARLDGHFAQTRCAVWRPVANELYTGGTDSNIIIWNICETLDAGQTDLRADSWSEADDDF